MAKTHSVSPNNTVGRKMSARAKVPARNTSPTGWWIYSEVQQWVSSRQKKLTAKSRCLVWENWRLIRAKTREEAHAKALRMGREGFPLKTPDGVWRFAGIAELLPVFDDLEDGAELLWTNHGKISVSRIQRMVRTKRSLAVFGDREDPGQPDVTSNDSMTPAFQSKSLLRRG